MHTWLDLSILADFRLNVRDNLFENVESFSSTIYH